MSTIAERLETVEQGWVLEAGGLHVLRQLTPDEWEDLGRWLRSRSERLQWALGDWLIYGGRDALAQGGLGRGYHKQTGGYARAMAITGYSKSYLSDLYRVADQFPLPRRRLSLTWGHHRLVLTIDDSAQQDALLDQAIAQDWSTTDVNDQIAQWLQRERPEQPRPALYRNTHGRAQTEVECPACHHRFPVRGHKVPRSIPA